MKKPFRLLVAIAALALASPLASYAAPPVINNMTQGTNTYGSGSVVQTYKGIAVPTIQINASNTPTSYTATPLPAGVTLNATTGAISGTPTAVTSDVTSTLNAINGDGTSVATVTLVFHINDTTVNPYTHLVTPTPTPAPTPNGTPQIYPDPDPQSNAGGNVSIVTSTGAGYIPNTPQTRANLNRLLQNGGKVNEHNALGHAPNQAPGLKADVGATYYEKYANWDGIQNTMCNCWHKVGTADTDWVDYND